MCGRASLPKWRGPAKGGWYGRYTFNRRDITSDVRATLTPNKWKHILSGLFGAVVDAGGQMVDEAQPLSDLDLLLLRQLSHRAAHVRRRMEHRYALLQKSQEHIKNGEPSKEQVDKLSW